MLVPALSITCLAHHFSRYARSLAKRIAHCSFALISLVMSNHVLANTNFIPSPPSINAHSYILMDAATGDTIIEHNADKILPPASLTKIMTSYVAAHEIAADKLALTDEAPVSIKAWKKGGSKMYIKEGTKVTIEDLLSGIVIQSGNDASIALSEYIAGGEDAFAELMNMHAKELGMHNTHFVNATGWPAEGHHTTAKDLAILTRALINKFPNHYALYKEKEFSYNSIKQPNRNLLLWRDSSVDGVKTGHTEEAGYCLVSSAVRNNMRLIAVVMGTNSRDARASQSLKLLNFGFRYYTTHTAYSAGTEIHKAAIWMGQSDTLSLGTAENVLMTIPQGSESKLETQVTLVPVIKAPIKKGQPMGSFAVLLDDKVLAEQTLIAIESIEEAGAMTQLWHWINLKFLSQDDNNHR